MRRYTIFFLFIFIGTLVSAQLLKIDSIMVPYKYLVHVPEVKGNEKMPLLLFLHGSGERGSDINQVRFHNPITIYKDSLNFPFLLISPQCPSGQSWNEEVLLGLLDEIEKKYPVDKDRVYVTGLSLGGNGTWKLAQRAAERFAAIAPVCGWGDSASVCMLRHTPVWAFHGEKDKVVVSDKSAKLITALQKIGGEAKLTLYPTVAHDSWDSAYANPELYKWLLSHKRIGTPVLLPSKEKKKFIGTYIYTNPTSRDTLTTLVVLEDDELWYSVPRYQFKAKMYCIDTDLFRLEGVPLQKDSELFFTRDNKNIITGHKYYPCDDTFIPKVH